MSTFSPPSTKGSLEEVADSIRFIRLAQARTGTGKTLAFLIPSIERLIRSSQQPQRGQISVLILSPTRELAIQIQDSAKVLLAGTRYKCDHVVGGTNMKSEINRLNNQQCG